jgi:putative acetyltransferase
MIVVRPYQKGDCEKLADIFNRSVRQSASRDYSPEQILAWAPDQRDMQKFSARLAAKPTFVAEVDGHAAGFTDLEASGHMDMLFVDPSFQRQGVARTLLDFVIASARAQDITRVHSEVSITARPVFERHGFTVLAEQSVEKNGQNFCSYRMEKIL